MNDSLVELLRYVGTFAAGYGFAWLVAPTQHEQWLKLVHKVVKCPHCRRQFQVKDGCPTCGGQCSNQGR